MVSYLQSRPFLRGRSSANLFYAKYQVDWLVTESLPVHRPRFFPRGWSDDELRINMWETHGGSCKRDGDY